MTTFKSQVVEQLNFLRLSTEYRKEVRNFVRDYSIRSRLTIRDLLHLSWELDKLVYVPDIYNVGKFRFAEHFDAYSLRSLNFLGGAYVMHTLREQMMDSKWGFIWSVSYCDAGHSYGRNETWETLNRCHWDWLNGSSSKSEVDIDLSMGYSAAVLFTLINTVSAIDVTVTRARIQPGSCVFSTYQLNDLKATARVIRAFVEEIYVEEI